MEKPWVYGGESSPSGKSRGRNPRGLRLLGFWHWDFPMDSIHHSIPLAFPNNVPLCLGGIVVLGVPFSLIWPTGL